MKTSEFYLSVRIGETTLTSVYIPPSLQDLEVSRILEDIPYSSLLVGDFNFRSGLSGDRLSTNLTRSRIILANSAVRGLKPVINLNRDTLCPRNDWIFAGIPLVWTYWSEYRGIYLNGVVNCWSDHGLMEVKVNLPLTRSVGPRQVRFSLKAIEPAIPRHFASSIFEAFHAAPLKSLLDLVWVDLSTGNCPLAHQALVDASLDALSSEVHFFCSKYLNAYDPEAVKSKPDPTFDLSNSDCSTRKSIRSWKRTMRADAAMNPVRSRDPNKSPMEECRQRFTALLGSREESFDVDLDPLRDSLDLKFADSWTEEAIQKCISNYPGAKAGGLDYWNSPRLIKVLASDCPSFLGALLSLFRILAATGRTPKAWLESKVHLLLKDPKEPFSDKTRPINLSSFLRRIFEKVLLRKILHKEGPWGQWVNLNPYQAGFRKGYSTLSHILLADQLSYDGYSESIFLDLKSAYDTVPWHRLHDILIARKCPVPILRLFRTLSLAESSLSLSVNQQLDPTPIKTTRGLFQGSCLSPFLFLIFIDTLAAELQLTGTGLVPLMFADDILLKVQAPLAQSALDICNTWAVNNGMTWGIDKCGSTLDQEVVLGGQVLPRVSNESPYKYLGCPHGRRRILWDRYSTQATSKHNSRLAGVSNVSSTFSVFCRLVIWKTFYRPLVEYAMAPAVIWGKLKFGKGLNPITQTLKDSFQRGILYVFGSGKYSQVMANVLGLGSFQNRLDQLQASLARHLKSLAPQNPFHSLLLPKLRSNVFIARECSKSDYLDAYERHLAARSPSTAATGPGSWTWKNYCTKKTLEIGVSSGLALEKYISTKCRLKNNAIDAAIHQPDPIGRSACLWRIGHAFARRTCLNCGKQFNRRHIKECGLLENDPVSVAAIWSPEFLMRLEQVQALFAQVPILANRPAHYTILDFYLDRRLYQSFQRAYDLIAAQVSAPSH
jgi:hypothetical protein